PFRPLEQQVFQEVRGPRVLRVLITGPGGRRNPKSYGTHPLHGLGHYPQTTRQYGTAHQASAVPGFEEGDSGADFLLGRDRNCRHGSFFRESENDCGSSPQHITEGGRPFTVRPPDGFLTPPEEPSDGVGEPVRCSHWNGWTTGCGDGGAAAWRRCRWRRSSSPRSGSPRRWGRQQLQLR